MPPARLNVWIFDPVLPFEKVAAGNPVLDTWHHHVLITNELLERVPHVEKLGSDRVQLSGGMAMEAPAVEIGLQIGNILVPKMTALVVDNGDHEILLGSSLIERIFGRKAKPSEKCGDDTSDSSAWRYTSQDRHDNSALSMEMYPLETPFTLKSFETVIKSQRTLYNVALIASGDIQVRGISTRDVDRMIEHDEGIPNSMVLSVSCIEAGSVWVSFTSGSRSALKYLGSVFETGASAKLAEQLANAKKAETSAQITEATRNDVAAQIHAEQERLRAENLQKTYETWRTELRAQLSFLDELIQHATSEDVVDHIKKKKNEAILQMADQQMVPIIRNIPGSYISYNSAVLELPESTESIDNT